MSGVEQVVNADCLEHMRTMPDNFVDAIVTDPPYGLAFMGAKWDSFGGSTGNETVGERRKKMNEYLGANAVVPAFASSHGHAPKLSEMREFQAAMTPVFEEALRVAKPGAHLLCFGGTRTFHRMACAIEDAGWTVIDCVMWVYGSGFPHGMDVGKKLQGWEGWNTALKPAWEPIIVARKPLDGTVASNLLAWGVGAINVDACRVPTGDNLNGGAYVTNGGRSQLNGDMRTTSGQGMFAAGSTTGKEFTQPTGRFPANLVHDGSEEVVRLFPQSDGQQADVTGDEPSHPADGVCYGEYSGRHEFSKRGDSGSAARFFNSFRDGEESAERTYADRGSTNFAAKPGMRREQASADRFFYCAKASKKDRGEGNHHPTVKPTALMEWLVKLVTPEGGTVLDPFAGSGSTLVACRRLGLGFIGIEREREYCEIIERRLSEPTQMRMW